MKSTCQNCLFWRIKGDSGDEGDPGIGICDNQRFIEQVTMLPEEHMTTFFGMDPGSAKFIANSIRTDGGFGCVHFAPCPEEPTD